MPGICSECVQRKVGGHELCVARIEQQRCCPCNLWEARTVDRPWRRTFRRSRIDSGMGMTAKLRLFEPIGQPPGKAIPWRSLHEPLIAPIEWSAFRPCLGDAGQTRKAHAPAERGAANDAHRAAVAVLGTDDCGPEVPVVSTKTSASTVSLFRGSPPRWRRSSRETFHPR